MKILIVEDDKKINDFIKKGLEQSQFNAISAYDGIEALDILEVGPRPDLIILDVMMPKLDGLTLLQTLRRKQINIPVIILSAKRSVEEKVQGLEFGADDYIEKPFAFSELLARIQVVLKRAQGKSVSSEPTELIFQDLKLDLISRVATRGTEKVELQPKEFSLLEYFLKNPERIITKTMILEKIYGYNFDTQTNVVDVLVYRLRSKVDNQAKKLIHTVRGVGYVLKD